MAKNRLEGRAQQPFSPWLHYAIVLSFIFIETVLNGVMLARGMETGLIGGWGVACAVSFFNVALLGFISGGFALRQANHIEIRHKVFGVVILGAIVALMYCSNLLVAHYRDALGGSDPATAGTTALGAWLATPFDPLMVRDVQSLWLLGLGLLFSFFGMAEGYMAMIRIPAMGASGGITKACSRNIGGN